jgi:hypothetical protein
MGGYLAQSKNLKNYRVFVKRKILLRKNHLCTCPKRLVDRLKRNVISAPAEAGEGMTHDYQFMII